MVLFYLFHISFTPWDETLFVTLKIFFYIKIICRFGYKNDVCDVNSFKPLSELFLRLQNYDIGIGNASVKICKSNGFFSQNRGECTVKVLF